MQTQSPSLAKTLNPPLFVLQPSSFSQFFNPLQKKTSPIRSFSVTSKSLKIHCLNHTPQFSRQNASHRLDVRPFAGRSKGKPGGTSTGRIEDNSEARRQAKRNARRKSRKLAEGLFYRLKNPHKNYPDNFSQEELEMIGLGYDRMVRFMEKDDPNLKHPYDWYKYGEFGPYSWRGVVLGDPIRGRFSDECVTMIGEVRNQEEWEKIEQFEMAREFQTRLDALDKNVKFRYFWVFVRHPRWRISELPWQQWTLVSEVVLEAGDQRLDKWNLMGRLGNKSRAMITQCAAWMRPDIIYVKRPVYQCRFEPQDDFFQAMTPLLDPETEGDYMFELVNDDGTVEFCTYFGGLCRMVRVNQKAFVDDVVNAYEKLSDEKKSKCLDFLLNNHPVPLLHPYTKEWKVKLEEMELGCDAPDDDGDHGDVEEEGQIMDWMEDDGDDSDGGNDLEEDEDDDIILVAEDAGDDSDGGNDLEEDEDVDIILDAEDAGDEELGIEEDDEDSSPEEDPNYWDEEFKKAMRSNDAMEKFAKRTIETANKIYEKQISEMEEMEKQACKEGDELAMRHARPRVTAEEWKNLGYGPFRKRIRKSEAPPGLFLRAAVRPFTYRNLVKEIVLTRHAILEGEIVRKK